MVSSRCVSLSLLFTIAGERQRQRNTALRVKDENIKIKPCNTAGGYVSGDSGLSTFCVCAQECCVCMLYYMGSGQPLPKSIRLQ